MSPFDFTTDLDWFINKGIHKEYPELSEEEFEYAKREVSKVPSSLCETVLHNICYKKAKVNRFHNTISPINSEPCEESKLEVHIHKHYMYSYGIGGESDSGRRKPVLYSGHIWNYYPIACSNNALHNLSDCRFAHTNGEISYHPLVYKTRLCNSATKDSQGQLPECKDRGKACPFAHSSADLRNLKEIFKEEVKKTQVVSKFSVETYKTAACKKELCRDKNCLHYHNTLERRRTGKYKYKNSMCSHVFVDGKYVDPSFCLNGDNCQYCHTKNELYYHKDNYKKNQCKRHSCRYGQYCPDIHSGEATSNPKLLKLQEKIAKVMAELVIPQTK
eukprot:TRINITY_DN15192_c0_g1_i1.p1 TRINITY_DN15192_c0_g1~~TRINITY_DN15192_c0_g1_i1.p1  ORF type:complete len:331 (+),score=78.16 TRINITY_DN15192_c0_g1_i1:467-1459(+)